MYNFHPECFIIFNGYIIFGFSKVRDGLPGYYPIIQVFLIFCLMFELLIYTTFTITKNIANDITTDQPKYFNDNNSL